MSEPLNPWGMPPLGDDDPPQVSRDVMDAAGNLLPTHTPANGWLPVATAPRDGRNMLLSWGPGNVWIGCWVQPAAPAWVPPLEGHWEYRTVYGEIYADVCLSPPEWWQPLPGDPPRPLGRFIE